MCNRRYHPSCKNSVKATPTPSIARAQVGYPLPRCARPMLAAQPDYSRCRAVEATANHSIVFVRIPKTGTKSLLDGVDLGVHPAKVCDWASCCCQSYEPGRKDVHQLRQTNGWPCGVKSCACQTSFPHAPQVWWSDAPHILWAEHELMAAQANRNVVWLTWLRRPLARTVSEYLHAKANFVMWDYTMPANVTFLEFLTSRDYAVGAQNRMVRMLGGRARHLADDKEGRAATDLAKQRLKMTTFLGLLERPRESLWLLRHLFPYARTSSNTVRRDVGDGSSMEFSRMLRLPGAESNYAHEIAMHKVLAANSLDEELYEYANDLLTERLHTMSACGMTRFQLNRPLPQDQRRTDIRTTHPGCRARAGEGS